MYCARTQARTQAEACVTNTGRAPASQQVKSLRGEGLGYSFFTSRSNFTLVYNVRKSSLVMFLCEWLPGCARLIAISHPASAARRNRARRRAVCTPHLRNSGSVLAPNKPAIFQRNESVAPPATFPSMLAR